MKDAGLAPRWVAGIELLARADVVLGGELARAADVVDLMRTVQERVLERSDIRLEPEVHLVGEFDRIPD